MVIDGTLYLSAFSAQPVSITQLFSMAKVSGTEERTSTASRNRVLMFLIPPRSSRGQLER